MLSSFKLRPGEDIHDFRESYRLFVDEMKKIELVESSGEVGRRQSDTPMDTDDERDHEYFVLMSFRDRVQLDAAYAFIEKHFGPGDAAHDRVYRRVLDPVFTCWQDLA